MEQDGNIVPDGTWLRAVRAEERDKGVDFRALACHASELTPYVRDQLSRAAQGIEELYASLPSPLTPDTQQREFWESGREEYVARVCEAVQRLGAALAAVGCTDNELAKAASCEEVVNEAKRDTSLVSSDDDESHVLDDECDREATILMELPSDTCTKVRESVI